MEKKIIRKKFVCNLKSSPYKRFKKQLFLPQGIVVLFCKILTLGIARYLFLLLFRTLGATPKIGVSDTLD
ncbi:MAG: hypothetical protein EOP00_00610 [Pedobacter sp.]|nr:MAG: hypothetical protein EOP00_00610 [Pedobacter sp.]